ncbi:MAG: hypothetical protein K2Y23_05290 [Cyanobacteria bacterium]|nr:hypothetical protein [Cyanobacteriota bacterium]
MSRTTYALWAAGTFVAIAVLVAAGQRIAPPQQASNSAESRHACKVDAPEALKAAGAQWCAIGLFKSVTVSSDAENVIAVLQFSPNGAQAWQIQSGGLINEFRSLTDRTAIDAKGKNVSVDVHDAADKRIAACARLTAEPMAKCEVK